MRSVMFSTLYFPKFFKTSYEKNIDAKLSSVDTLRSDRRKFQALLELKKHASKIATSLVELKGVIKANQIDSFNEYFSGIIEKVISGKRFNPALYRNELNNRFSLLKDEVNEFKSFNKFFSGFNIFSNSIIATAGALGVVLFGAAVCTGPLGLALLAVGMAIVSALVLAIAAYSIYVDARFIGDKQLEEIEAGVKFLSNYNGKNLLSADVVEKDSSIPVISPKRREPITVTMHYLPTN